MAYHRSATRNRIAIGASLVAIGILAYWLVWGRAVPQMGTSQEAFTAVDALFTAINARDEALLARCEQHLHSLAEKGHITDAGAARLNDIVTQARAGQWPRSAQRLYHFVEYQGR